MKLKEYLKELNHMVQTIPECLDFDVITSSDDEGNDFDIVGYVPSLGFYEDREFIPNCRDKNLNAICLN